MRRRTHAPGGPLDPVEDEVEPPLELIPVEDGVARRLPASEQGHRVPGPDGVTEKTGAPGGLWARRNNNITADSNRGGRRGIVVARLPPARSSRGFTLPGGP